MRTAPRVQGDKGDPEFEFPRRLIGWRRSRDPRSAALIGRAAGGRVAMFKATVPARGRAGPAPAMFSSKSRLISFVFANKEP